MEIRQVVFYSPDVLVPLEMYYFLQLMPPQQKHQARKNLEMDLDVKKRSDTIQMKIVICKVSSYVRMQSSCVVKVMATEMSNFCSLEVASVGQ